MLQSQDQDRRDVISDWSERQTLFVPVTTDQCPLLAFQSPLITSDFP